MFALRLARFVAVVFLLLTSARLANAQAAATAYEPKHVEYPATVDGLPGVGPISDSVNFKRLWPQRRQQFVNRVEKDHGALVFFGDSITQGWGNNFGGQFGKQKVANRGISGDTTRGMLVRVEDVIALDPSGVVMLMGTNDLARAATPEMVAGNVKEIIAELKEHDEKLPIVLCAIMPSAASKDRPKEKIIATNKLLHEAVKDEPQVTFFDTYELFADENGDAPAEEFPDLLHPNKAGYAKWAEALRPVLVERGFEAVAEAAPMKKPK
jgi:lysophospholipase L1-like esterase